MITLSTSRKMWFRADPAPGGRRFARRAGRHAYQLARSQRQPGVDADNTALLPDLVPAIPVEAIAARAPEFGIGPAQYEEFATWLSTAVRGPLDRMPSYYRFDEPLALAESIGLRVFRWLYALWPKAKRLGPVVERLYVAVAACATAVSIAVLMPPTLILGRLPPVRRWVRKAEAEILSAVR